MLFLLSLCYYIITIYCYYYIYIYMSVCTFDSQIHGRFVSNSRILRFPPKATVFHADLFFVGQKWDEPQICSGLVWYYPFWRGLSQILSHTHLSLSKNRPFWASTGESSYFPYWNQRKLKIFTIASTCCTSKGHHWTSASPPRQSCSIPDLAPEEGWSKPPRNSERGDFFAVKQDDFLAKKNRRIWNCWNPGFSLSNFPPHEKNGLVVLETAREADKDTPLLMG